MWITPSRDPSEPDTSSSWRMMKDATLYKEMQLKQSSNETKILPAIPSSGFSCRSCLFSVLENWIESSLKWAAVYISALM